MYKRILLAYDGSLEGAVALREGALLAKRSGARVFILCVVPRTTGVRLAEGACMPGPSLIRSTVTKMCSRAASRRVGELGLEPVAKLVAGEPAREIGAFAKDIAADLVVVGHRRRNMLERWWSGSSGAYVSDYIGCSLLIGRNTVSDAAFEAEMRVAGAPRSADSSADHDVQR